MGGSQYFNLLKELIEKTKNSFYSRIYIWDDDATGTFIADKLIKAAQKNVAVFVLLMVMLLNAYQKNL